MVNLLNSNLRIRDIRKLVEPYFHHIHWDAGVDETSEWVAASFEDNKHTQRLISWLNSKTISSAFNVLLTDKAWSELKSIAWGDLLENPEYYLNQKHVFVVAADRSWVMEYAPQQIIRFGRWSNVT